MGIIADSYRASTFELPSLSSTNPNVTDADSASSSDSSQLPLPNWSSYQALVNQYSNDDQNKYYASAQMPLWIHQQEVPVTDNGEEYIAEYINYSLRDWGRMFYAISHDTQNPITMLQWFGRNLVNNSIQAYKQEGAYFADKHYEEWWKNLISDIFGNQDIDKMISAMWYLPLGISIITIMLTSGLLLEIYIPLVPFILFTLGGIGWLMGVIEAMLAAPIVCFSIIHPNSQNDFVGKAEPAVMLIINMFLRPTLMIMGMLMGIGLMFVAANIFSTGFSAVVSSLLTFDRGMRSVMSAAVLMGIFSVTLTLLANKCFALIHIIPDNVLRWIQGGETTRGQFGELGAQTEKEISGAVNQGVKQVAQGMGQSEEKFDQNQIQLAERDQKMEQGMFRGL